MSHIVDANLYLELADKCNKNGQTITAAMNLLRSSIALCQAGHAERNKEITETEAINFLLEIMPRKKDKT